jgi:hypothetical protein
MAISIDVESRKFFSYLQSQSGLSQYTDTTLSIPQIYRGNSDIKLIILGQDPTVKNINSRRTITTVLNLNRPGSLRKYISQICDGLGITPENIYATNYLKNFFITPPTQIKEINIFKEFGPYWLPLLKEEIAQYPNVPVISLGQPLLKAIVKNNVSPLVHDYWGYLPKWRFGVQKPFRNLETYDNVLDRTVYPFPHQPSIRKKFYADRLIDYCSYVKGYIEQSK